MAGMMNEAVISQRILGSLAVSAAMAFGVAACGGSSGGSTTTVTQSASSSAETQAAGSPAQTSSAPAQTSNAPAQTNGGAAQRTGGQSAELPDYKPSTVVSKTAGATILTSPDNVSKIGAFYRDALARGGWHTVSSSSGPYNASFTARRPGQGASGSVYPRGSGAGISITVHPQ